MAKVEMAGAPTSARPLGDELFTVAEACRFFKCSVPTVYAMLNDGRLEGLKLGRATRITGNSLRRCLDELPRIGAGEAA